MCEPRVSTMIYSIFKNLEVFMDEIHYTKNDRNFVVRFEEGEVYIGTCGYVSNISAQLVCHETMAPLKWKPTGTFMNLEDKDGYICIGVGYKVPRFVNPRKKIEKLLLS